MVFLSKLFSGFHKSDLNGVRGLGGWADRAAFKMIKVAACRDSESPTKRRKFQLNVKAKQILTLLALCPKVHTGICSLHIEIS